MVELDIHWAKVWERRDPDEVSWFQMLPERSLRLIMTAAPDRSSPVIDVGGGASRLVDGLLDAGYRDVTVLDIAERSLERARARLGDDADTVAWVVGDVTDHGFDRRYAVWHDRAVLHFLTEDADRRRYVERLIEAVDPDGYAVIATFGPDGPESCSGLPVRRQSPDDLTDLLGATFAPITFEDEIHVTPAGIEQPFVYGIFRRTP